MIAPHVVGILGGMGPAAGSDFSRLFVNACEVVLVARGEPVTDQAFPEHWLAQVPLPDRTEALLGEKETPLPGMLKALRQLSALGARSVAVACNTAHAWHEELQARCPDIELLHIVSETTRQLAIEGVTAVGLMATVGTHRLGLYEASLGRAGIRHYVPSAEEQALVMRGIVQGVKGGDLPLARACFEEVAGHLALRHGIKTLVLACTEIPLALQSVPGHPEVRLVNPADTLAKALADRAYSQAGLFG
ncbi:MAG TPA: amino acid racemase [Polaromonas sp.]|jgi:aspartate racemase